jgi:hypothetical protein
LYEQGLFARGRAIAVCICRAYDSSAVGGHGMW